jgi:hypothetical protein
MVSVIIWHPVISAVQTFWRCTPADPPFTPPVRPSIIPPDQLKVEMRPVESAGLPLIQTPRLTPTIEQLENYIQS